MAVNRAIDPTSAASGKSTADLDALLDEMQAPPVPLGSNIPPDGSPDDADAPKGVMYEDRIVAFVDILGFKDIVYQSKSDMNLVNQIYGALDIRNDELARHFAAEVGLERDANGFDDRFHTFSDCIVMSVRADSEELGLLVFMVFKICRQLLHAGFLSRGGIACGKLLHRTQDNSPEESKPSPMVFGPAFIDAYNLEANHADGARVILQTAVWRMIDAYCKSNETERLGKFFQSHVARAEDGPAFVNLFADFPGNVFYAESTDVAADIEMIHQRLCKALNETSDKPHQFRKNAILAKEFNLAIGTAMQVPRYNNLAKHMIPTEILPRRL